MTQNGTVTYTRDDVPTGELGSLLGADRLFGYWDADRWLTPIAVDDQLIDNMLRIDGRAQTIAQVLTLPLRGVEATIEPADGDSGECDWLIDALTTTPDQGGMQTPLNLVLDQLTNGVLYKRSYFEKVFRVSDDGRVLYDKLAYRPPASCQLATTDTGDPKGFRQRAWKGGEWVQVDIPAIKSMIHVNRRHQRPIDGVSDVETAYALFEHRQKVRFMWYSALENEVLQKAIAKHSSNDKGEVQAFAKDVATLKSGGVIGIGPDQSVTPYGPSSAAEFETAMNSLASEMAQSVLAGFVDLTSGATGTGSFALSKDATDFFLKSRTAALMEMSTTMVHQAFAPLIRFNLGPQAKVPLLKFGSLVQESAQAAVTMLTALAAAPALTFPGVQVFMAELVEKCAAVIGLDASKVHDAVEQAAEQQATPTGQLQAGIASAAQLVSQANLGVQTPQAPAPAPA